MKAKARFVNTPVGPFKFPLDPAFTRILEKCETNEDLFKLVEVDGFINPDAFTELLARDLIDEYNVWDKQKTKGYARGNSKPIHSAEKAIDPTVKFEMGKVK